MSKVVKIAAILGVAVVVIAAKQFSSPNADKSVVALSAAPAASVSPEELMRDIGPLRETQIDSLY